MFGIFPYPVQWLCFFVGLFAYLFLEIGCFVCCFFSLGGGKRPLHLALAYTTASFDIPLVPLLLCISGVGYSIKYWNCVLIWNKQVKPFYLCFRCQHIRFNIADEMFIMLLDSFEVVKYNQETRVKLVLKHGKFREISCYNLLEEMLSSWMFKKVKNKTETTFIIL